MNADASRGSLRARIAAVSSLRTATLELAKPHDDRRTRRSAWPCRSTGRSPPRSRRWNRRSACTPRPTQYGVAEVSTPATLCHGRPVSASWQVTARIRAAGADCRPTSSSNTTCCSRSKPSRSRKKRSRSTNPMCAAPPMASMTNGCSKSYAALAELKPARYVAHRARSASSASPFAGPEPPRPRDPVARNRSATGHRACLARLPDATSEAAQQLEAALNQHASSAEGLEPAGIAYRRLGRMADARDAYERAIAADPAMPAPQRNLAVLLDLYLAQPAAALEHYEQLPATRRWRGPSDRARGPPSCARA